MENKKEKQLTERYEIAKILADNFTPETYDESDFEWCAFQLVQAGYRKQSEVAKEIFEEIESDISEGVSRLLTAIKLREDETEDINDHDLLVGYGKLYAFRYVEAILAEIKKTCIETVK